MTTKKDKEIALVSALLAKPIAVNPVLIDLTGSHEAAILLSQAIYWEKTMGREFWKTNEEWMQELRMKVWMFDTAKKKASKYLHIEKKGMPARNHYSVRWEVERW